jgi:hypothetical protein
MKNSPLAVLTLAASLLGAPALAGDKVSFKDPTGDDNGPGKYTYPTDAVYKRGSFDLTGFEFSKKGDKADITLSFNANLEDPWRMGTGFAVQMAFVFIDMDGKEGSGFTEGLPGTNIQFAPEFAWDRVIVVSPQGPARVKAEVTSKAGAMKDAVIIPSRTKGSGRKVTASVDSAGILGDPSMWRSGDPSMWRWQVVVQSNEGFPADNDMLTRRVNEYEGQHRFGGGSDGNCDPHVIDVLAGMGKGEESEKKAQYDMLAYECAEDGTTKKMATLTMVGGPAKPAMTEAKPAEAAKPAEETKPAMGSDEAK